MPGLVSAGRGEVTMGGGEDSFVLDLTPLLVPRAPVPFNSCAWATVILLPVSLSFLFPGTSFSRFLSFATPVL